MDQSRHIKETKVHSSPHCGQKTIAWSYGCTGVASSPPQPAEKFVCKIYMTVQSDIAKARVTFCKLSHTMFKASTTKLRYGDKYTVNIQTYLNPQRMAGNWWMDTCSNTDVSSSRSRERLRSGVMFMYDTMPDIRMQVSHIKTDGHWSLYRLLVKRRLLVSITSNLLSRVIQFNTDKGYAVHI